MAKVKAQPSASGQPHSGDFTASIHHIANVEETKQLGEHG
jgi:hypothetical protein